MELFSLNFTESFVNLVFMALLAFFVPVLVGYALSSSINQLISNRKSKKFRIYKFLSDTSKIVGFVFGVISALGTIGVNISALIAGLGLTGLGLSLALKDAISNFIAGLMLIVYDPFSINSRIKMGDIEGVVIDMDLRYVTIKTEKDTSLIPNANFLTSAVKIMDEGRLESDGREK